MTLPSQCIKKLQMDIFRLFKKKKPVLVRCTECYYEFDLSPREVRLLEKKNIELEKALDEVELSAMRNRPFSNLSGGDRQLVLIARALAAEPELLLLDEPMASVDAVVERELHELLGGLNQRMTVVTVTHDLGFVSAFVETVVCVNHKVVIHPTSDLTSETIADIYGGPFRMVRHDRHDERGGRTCPSS